MIRTLIVLGTLACSVGLARAEDEPLSADDGKAKGAAVFERDEELRRLLSLLQSSRANEDMARHVLEGLLESKTEKHPKVMAARNRLTQAEVETAKALADYQAARKAKGLPPLDKTPELPPGDARLVSAKAEVELSRARLRMLMDRRAVVEDELKSLTASKTKRHPKVRSASTRKAKLDVQVAEVQARIAREQDHVDWLERKRKEGAPDSLTTLSAKVDALTAEVAGLRKELAEMKALLKAALEK